MKVKRVKITRAGRCALNEMAAMYGVKRKWCGLEPNFMLRRRIELAMRDQLNGGEL